MGLRPWRRRLPLSETQIKERHAVFAKRFPGGLLSKDDFVKLATPYLESNQIEQFADNTFNLFDEDKDGWLDFGEFALAASALDTTNSVERVVWMFDRLFDKEDGENIDSRKAEEVLAGLLEMEMVTPASSRRQAKRVLEELKLTRYGVINKDDFVEKALKSQVLFK